MAFAGAEERRRFPDIFADNRYEERAKRVCEANRADVGFKKMLKRARFSSREPNGRRSPANRGRLSLAGSDRVAGLATCSSCRESRRMDKKLRRRRGLARRRNRFRVGNLRRRTLLGALRRISRRDAGLRNDVEIHLERSPSVVKSIQDGRGISYTTQTSRTFLRFLDFCVRAGLTSEHSCEEK